MGKLFPVVRLAPKQSDQGLLGTLLHASRDGLPCVTDAEDLPVVGKRQSRIYDLAGRLRLGQVGWLLFFLLVSGVALLAISFRRLRSPEF